MALYQAATSNKNQISSTNMLGETENITVAGGLANVKKRFEKTDIASSRSAVTQYQHKSVKETKQTNNLTVTNSTQVIEQQVSQGATQFSSSETEKASAHEQSISESNMLSNYNQEGDAVAFEQMPKNSTQVLKDQFERSLKEKSICENVSSEGKQAKIHYDYPEFEWPVVNTSLNDSASRAYEEITTAITEHTSSSVNASCSNFGSLEDFPPPPPDILHSSEKADFSQSPEPLSSIERHGTTVSKDLYSKQRNLFELKRLYKHIHPEVRKNLEKESYNEVSDIVASQNEQSGIQQAKYAFENAGYSQQKCVSPEREYLEWDEILKGEVQSMRWVFENQPLDTIKDESSEQSHIKSIGEQEIIAGGDVKYTTWMFETQPIHALSTDPSSSSDNVDKVPELARGDVRTATWLFETQPLDCLNKIYKEKDTSEIADGNDDIREGDVKTRKHLFETHFNSQLCSVDEINLLRLRSELQEIKGDVKRTVKQFETEPKYFLKDSSGKVMEIKTVCREDIEKGDVKTARWLFETQPLDTINQEEVEIKVVRGISMEENVKGGVGRAKWIFETNPLDTIKEQADSFIEKETVIGADVYQKCWLFETVPMDVLKDNSNDRPQLGEEIIGGDVSNTKYLFETVPMDELKENVEVGRLKQVVTIEEEKGDVRHQRWVFETKPLEQIREEKKEYIRTVKLDDIHRGNFSSCKNAFETENWSKCSLPHKINVEHFDKGAVKINRKLFETTPIYAIQDRFGNYHEVQTIRQEEVVRGDVRTCQWMFETIPIDQFVESVEKYQLIKGISSKEIQSGDVKTGKWLFETQPLDSIKYFSNVEDEEVIKESDIVKGDVKKCKWLFETQPMETLYEKDDTIRNNDDIQKGDVKTCTWLFETQSLDLIQDESEKSVSLQTVHKEEIQGKDVQTACILFETENLENIQGEEKKDFKRVVETDVQSGDVSTMKYIFENQSLDKISTSSEEVLQKIKSMKSEDLQNGNVLNCRWLFENHSMDEINADQNENKSTYAITDVQGGNVRKGCFIFETFSLDQIKHETSEDHLIRTVGYNEIIKGDVKNYTLMFETQPLYAIQDKEGFYHEVTTVKKEEVSHGNVRGTRWLFETKPLDSFNDSENIYIIKAVTQEDIQKGDVSSVRWKFETQSLDTISDHVKENISSLENIQGGNVQANKQFFEEEQDKNQFVRTVSISEIKHGNVKTSTWLFESHKICEIHGDDYQNIKTVTMEDVSKGDVKEAIWLFENQSLDLIREVNESGKEITKDEIPQADVSTTTWLFETTPLHEFNEHKIERQEIIGKSIQETLRELYNRKIVESHGIILEADEIGDVRMAKYLLMNQESPEIQREEIIRGDLQNIMMNLLSQNSTSERMVLLNDEERGNVQLTKSQLLNCSSDLQLKREDIMRGDVQEAIKNLLSSENFVKQGILIQENEKGDIQMTVYSLFNKNDSSGIERDKVVGGDIKRTISSLKSYVTSNEKFEKVKLDDSERGNVQFYTTCIESGALDYLRKLQKTSDDIEIIKENEEIIGGDVEGTKLLLKRHQFQVERTVDEADIIPGDVCNTVKVFMTEPDNKSLAINKEEITKGDLKATLNSLSQAINQTVVVEKEEIIKADLPATLKSLSESQYQIKDIEKPDVIPGDIQGTIDSLEKAVNVTSKFAKEEVIHGNLEATLKSLKDAQRSVKEVEKESVIRGDINAAVQSLINVSAEKKNVQHQVSVQGDVKSTMKTLLQPSVQTVHRKASIEGDVQSTIKTLFQSDDKAHCKNKILIEDAGPSEQLLMVKNACKNQESSLHQNFTETSDALDDVTLKNDRMQKTNDYSGQYIDSRETFCKVDKKQVKVKQLETNKVWKKHSTFSDAQTAEQISEGKTCLLQGLSEENKGKASTDIINQNKVMQKAKLSSSINTSKSTESHQAKNVINRGSYQVSDHVHKQVTNQQTQHNQHSGKTLARNEVNIQQAQVLDSINNNIENAENVHTVMDMNLTTKETEKKMNAYEKKCIQKVIEKSETGSYQADGQFLMKNHLQSTKVVKDQEKSDSRILLPPSPPPPPQPILPSFRSSAEPEHFPSPPPPVTDKLDHEVLPPPPLTPPPLVQYTESAHKIMSSLSHQDHVSSHSEQSKLFTGSSSVKKLEAAQKNFTTEHVSKPTEKQRFVVPHKSKLPVFQHKKGDTSINQIAISKQFSETTSASEYEQKISAYQSNRESAEHSESICESETIHQQIVTPKSKVLISLGILPDVKIKHSLEDMENVKMNKNRLPRKEATSLVYVQNTSNSHTNAEDYEQSACDHEIKNIHQETLQPKKRVLFSPSVSPALQTDTSQAKKFNRTNVTNKETAFSVYEQTSSSNQLNSEDLEQIECDRELEQIHQETLQAKKKVFFAPRMSPALRTDTPQMKPKQYVRKFKTPLMIAEEKYRQQREEMEKNKEKVIFPVPASLDTDCKKNNLAENLEITKSSLSGLSHTTVTANDDVNNQECLSNAVDSLLLKGERQNEYNHVTMQKSSSLVSTSNASSLLKSETLTQETKLKQLTKVVKEDKAIELANQQYIINESRQANNVAQLQAKDRDVSSKPEAKTLTNSSLEPNKSEINLKQVKSGDSMKSSKNVDQRVTDDSESVQLCEKNINQRSNTQSISHSSEQQKIGKSMNVLITSNDEEMRKAPNRNIDISVIKDNESLYLPQLQKELIKKDTSVRRKTFDIKKHPEKPKVIVESKAHQESTAKKEQVQEKQGFIQNIVKDKHMHETQSKNEIKEKRQVLFSSMESQNKKEIKQTDVIECLRKCEELKKVVSEVNQFELNLNTLNKNTFKVFLNIVPTWLIGADKKNDIADISASCSLDEITKHISFIKHYALEMQSSLEGTIHAAIQGSSTTKDSNESSTISGISHKQITNLSKQVKKSNIAIQEKTKVSNEFSRVAGNIKQSDFRSCSPSLKMRSPSPTYITIESTARRTESPQKEHPQCASPQQKEPSAVPLPPRRSVTPKLASCPSPQKSRSEQLAKLKDTTAKLSHGTAQPRAVTPVPIVVEKKCEIVHSPATLRRQLKIESHAAESICTKTVPASEVSVSIVKARKEVHEDDKKTEVHKVHTQKDSKHTSEWLGQDLDSLDVVSVTKKIEIPNIHSYESTEKKFFKREEPILHEKFKFEKKDKSHKTAESETKYINFNTNKANQSVNKSAHQENNRSAPETKPSPQDFNKGKVRTVPIRQIKGNKENASKQIFINRHHDNTDHLFSPMMHSETISITEQVSGVDKVEKKSGRSRVPQSSESVKPGFDFKHAPPTYEDVISGHMLDISAAESPEELMKNFQKTWEESERVFKSLGYTVSDTSEMRSSFHQEEFISENASGQGNVYYLSKEGIPNGIPNDRQADLS